MHARRNALAADVVVVNHHLFFADVVLRDEGVAELLPACNTVIFDEAHQLPETASLFFGETVSTAQLIELARDARIERAPREATSPAPERLAGGWTRRRATCGWSLGNEGAPPAAGAGFAPARLRRRAGGARRRAGGARRAPGQAGRALRGLESCAPARGRGARGLARMHERRRRRTRCAGSRSSASRCSSTRRRCPRGAFPAPDGGPSAGLDLHLGHARGGRGLRPLPAASWASRRRTRGAGTARSTSPARRCSMCPRACPIPTTRISPRRWSRPPTRCSRERRPRLSAVHQPARDAARARDCSPRASSATRWPSRCCCRARVAQRAAGALSRARQRRAARQPVVLGRRGRARRSAVAGDHRQAAVRARPTIRCWRRASSASTRRDATRSWNTSCRRRSCS